MERTLLDDTIERVAMRHIVAVSTVISELDRRVRHRDGGTGQGHQIVPAMATTAVRSAMIAPAMVESATGGSGTKSAWQPRWWGGASLALACLAAIAGAELVVALINPTLGVAAHSVILAVLLSYGAFGGDVPGRRLALSLAIAPIIRITSLGLPLSVFNQPWRYAVASLPLLVAAFVLIRVLALSRSQVALQLPPWRHWPTTLLVASSGIPLGWAEYRILRPWPLPGEDSLGRLASTALVLVIATGVTEELIFRGILQTSAIAVFGLVPGIVFVSLLFGVLHIGHRSTTDVAFVIGVALYFGGVVHWTRTLLGVTLAHGVTNIVLFAILPLASPRPPLW